MTIDRRFPERDIGLLSAVLGKIEADPSSWNQEHWFCGTSACYAGHTCILRGWEKGSQTVEAFVTVTNFVTKDGEERSVRSAAMQELGISSIEADVLFAATNTIDDLRRIVAKLVADQPVACSFCGGELNDEGCCPDIECRNVGDDGGQ